MTIRTLLLAATAAVGLVGCARESEVEPPSATTDARAELRDSGGRLVANASVISSGDRLRVRVEASGLAPGSYAAHIHAVGRCDPPSFESAGAHWNPTGREHGSQNPDGAHLGDLPNLLVGANGEGSFEFGIAGASLSGGRNALLDEDGAALVIHASPDDYRTDPSGNSGARLACGVLD